MKYAADKMPSVDAYADQQPDNVNTHLARCRRWTLTAHPHFRNACDGLSLISHHWPSAADAKTGAFTTSEPIIGKKEGLAEAALPNHGPHMTRLLTSDDLSYYNRHATRR